MSSSWTPVCPRACVVSVVSCKVRAAARFDAQPLMDIMEDEDAGHETNAALMDQVQSMCSAAAEKGGACLASHDDNAAAVDFLRQRHCIQTFEDGTVALSPELLVFGLSCEDHVLETSTRNRQTAYEMSCALTAQGWQGVTANRQASLRRKRFVEDRGPYAYYYVLLHFGDALIDGYSHEFLHGQSGAYYEAMEAALLFMLSLVQCAVWGGWSLDMYVPGPREKFVIYCI